MIITITGDVNPYSTATATPTATTTTTTTTTTTATATGPSRVRRARRRPSLLVPRQRRDLHGVDNRPAADDDLPRGRERLDLRELGRPQGIGEPAGVGDPRRVNQDGF